jgi:hypothetical protein
MIVKNLLIKAMKKIGVAQSGETPEAEDLQDALESLQSMLHAWASKQILVFASTKEHFTLVSGKNPYSWGSVAADIVTARPHMILGAVVRDTNDMDHPVNIISEGQYRAYSLKTLSERPRAMWLHPLYPLANLYVFPVAATGEECYIDSLKPFTQTSSFDTLFDTIAFPENYEEPVIYNLAVRIAPEYGKSISPEVAAIAESGYNALVSLNSGNQVENLRLTNILPAGITGRYDINLG